MKAKAFLLDCFSNVFPLNGTLVELISVHEQ